MNKEFVNKQKRYYLIRFFLLCIILSLRIQLASACSCHETPSNWQLYNNADLVVQVRREGDYFNFHYEGLPILKGLKKPLTRAVKIKVEKIFKGDLQEQVITIGGSFAEAMDSYCGWSVPENKSLILFLERGAPTWFFHPSSCSPKWSPKSKEKLNFLMNPQPSMSDRLLEPKNRIWLDGEEYIQIKERLVSIEKAKEMAKHEKENSQLSK